MPGSPKSRRAKIVVRRQKTGRAAWDDPTFDPLRPDPKPFLISHNEYPELCKFALKRTRRPGDLRFVEQLGTLPHLSTWPWEFIYPANVDDAQGAFGDSWNEEAIYNRGLDAVLADLKLLPPELVRSTA